MVVDVAVVDANLDKLLRTAIAERRLVAFNLFERPRLVEPHDYGVIDGVLKLLCYQVGGESRSGRPHGWRWALLSEISELHLTDRHFAGSRSAPSGQHVRWDRLFASVSRPSSEESGRVPRVGRVRR